MTHQPKADVIVCATRGGQGSRAVQTEAVRRARAGGQRLVFLYVADPREVGVAPDGLASAIMHELSWLGFTLLHLAQQRAAMQGLSADVAIRQGDLEREIEAFVREVGATVLFLGTPRGTTARFIGDDAIERFAQDVEADTDVEVELVRPD